jgi:hypothetical protein
MTEKNQLNLFEDKKWWAGEWEGMPEYDQDDLTSFRKVIVHFRNREDVDRFAELIGQKITPNQLSLWFPELKKVSHTDKAYIDES